jgi:integrase
MRYQLIGRTARTRVADGGGGQPDGRRERVRAMGEGAYRFAIRPAAVAHGHPVLVFDRHDRLHLPLTQFAKEAHARVSMSTALAYVRSLLPFFTALDTRGGGDGPRWNRPPAEVRRAVDDYLVRRLRCHVRAHRAGFQLVAITAGTRSTVRVFLSALKLFYRTMQTTGAYAFPNPLVEPVTGTAAQVDEGLDDDGTWPRMPDVSGVAAPRRTPRLSDSYFTLVGDAWLPQIVDDPALPARVLAGGRRLPGWRLRDECVTRLLFESGGRVSEITGLTLADWVARGMLQEATTFSKGSRGVRVKFLRFSSDTAKLLRRYVDTERQAIDPRHLTCADLLRRDPRHPADVLSAPVFLTARRTPLTAKNYREHAWNPACAAAGIDADVHQARHWYVTMAVRQIYETATTDGAVQRRLRELIEYMKWRRGGQTLEAYEHYFDAVRHAEIQDRVHARLDEALRTAMAATRRGPSGAPAVAASVTPEPGLDEPEWAYLQSCR